jgi:DNA mismatch repair ATPase MutS
MAWVIQLMYATVEYLTNSTNFVKNRLLTKEDDEFTAPLVFIVTHLSEILNSKIIEESYRVRFLTMMVEQEGICLYKVRPGLVARGYGIRAAKSIMPEDFITLSEKYLELLEGT